MSMHIGGVGGSSGTHVVSGASPYAAPTTKMSNLFDRIDAGSSGSITQSQFNQAFNTLKPPGVFKKAGASAIFSRLDPGNTGSVSKSDFVSSMTGLMRSLRGGPSASTSDVSGPTPPAPSPAQTLASSLQSLSQLGGSPDAAGGIGTMVDLSA